MFETRATPVGLTLLLLMASTLAADAQPYSTRRSGEVVELEDAASQTVVSILPSVGNIAFSMKVKGQDVLRWPYASVDEFKARPGLSGIPFLSPWANRLDEQAFYANGKRYPFDMTLGNVRGAIPSHGFLTTNDQWQVVEAKADSGSAWLTSKLDFYKNPAWMKQWPFAHTVEMTYRLQAGVLQVQTTIRNMAAEPMPVSVGFHPYYRLTDSPRADWTISVPAKTRWVLAANKVPTGETEPADVMFPNGRSGPLRDYNLDDVFSDLVRDPQGRAHVVLKGRQQQLEIMLGANWRSLVMWSPNPAGTGKGSNALSAAPARATQPPAAPPPATRATQATDPNFICFEPMAGISNALNLAHAGKYKELQYIQPGGTWQESFWIKPGGF